MSVDERDDDMSLGELFAESFDAADAIAATITDADIEARLACIHWHHAHDRRRRRDALVGWLAAFLALATVVTAALTYRESWAGVVALAALAAIVWAAWRSGGSVNAERDHLPTCTRRAS